MEDRVADTIRKAGLELKHYMKRTTEVDSITVMGGETTAIEVESGNNNMSRSRRSLMGRGIVQRGIEFETCNIHVDADGVEHCPRFVSGFMDRPYERGSLVVDGHSEEWTDGI